MKRLAVMLVLIIPGSTLAAPVIGNAGFESVVPIFDFPFLDYGIWTGNEGQMVTAENGITPIEGVRMLKFTGTVGQTNIWDLVDVTSLPAGSEVQLSAAFNRIAGSPSTVQMRLSAIDSVPPVDVSSVDQGILAIVQQDIPNNAWTTLHISATLPANTIGLAVEVAYTGLGAYADNVQFTPTPEPSSIVMGFFGLVGLIALGWRRRNRA